jgi:hypothetical protein
MTLSKTIRTHERELMLAMARSRGEGREVSLPRETTKSLLRTLAIAAKYMESPR